MKVYDADHFLRTPFIVRRFVSPERFRRDLKAYFALCSLSGCRLSVGLWSCVLPNQGRLLWDEPTATMRQVLRSCRSETVEQPSSWSVTSWH